MMMVSMPRPSHKLPIGAFVAATKAQRSIPARRRWMNHDPQKAGEKRDRINRVAQPADHSQPEPRADCAVQKFKRSSAAVATNREGHRFPRSGKAERLRGKPLNEADV